jgi:hypothetical protein
MAQSVDKMTEALSLRHAARWRRIRFLSRLLDDKFRVPGTTYRVGLDGLLGLIPGIGDALGLLLSAYILFEARNLGAPPSVLLRMVTNIGIDALVGTIPLLGDVFDLAWKANRKNMALLQTYQNETKPSKMRESAVHLH